MQELLEKIIKDCQPYTEEGRLANYIPELAKANKNALGICVMSDEGRTFCVGDYAVGFTMQSVVKPLILLLALLDKGVEQVCSLVGVEATGKPFDAFNYSDQALTGAHINPMVNTGAIALCTLINGATYEEKFERLLSLAKRMTGNPNLSLDTSVYLSEKATGHKNRALAYMLKAYGMIHEEVEDVVDLYFRACSIKVDCKDLANIARILADQGVDRKTGERIIEAEYTRYINAIMTTSGMYDGSGEFAFNVGIPAKSGVGGGIMAVVPRRMGIGIYAPALDKKGNSVAGRKALELLSKQLGLSIF
ncbi:MAG: glutaminase A [Clostridia bacterium]|nr:glutaminase A [Clostridia bacterium]